MTDESMRKTIAGNISRYRKQLGMTQLDLSEKINYSDKSISKWERGDGIPDVPTWCSWQRSSGYRWMI
ncbi:MAG: helix-turn-helix transcriptional regulator [Ruminococcus sp.]